jgi:hypothetical protein
MIAKPSTEARRAELARRRGKALSDEHNREQEKLFKALGPAGVKKLRAQREREAREQMARDNLRFERMARDSEINKLRQNLPPNSELVKLVHELEAIAGYKTSSLNPNSMSEKDTNSHRAFQLAGQLIGPLLKWAIDHEAGKIIGNNASLVEWQRYFNENPKYAALMSKRNLAANSHDNELRGLKYAGNDNRVDRELAALVFYSISRGMGFNSGNRVGEALTILKHGKVAPVLKPPKNSLKQKSYKRDEARLMAIRHVEFRRGLGALREDALKQVAGAYALAPATILQWQKESIKRLPTLDPAYVVHKCKYARWAGQVQAAIHNPDLARELPLSIPPLDLTNEIQRKRIEKNVEENYSDARLALDGKKFHAPARVKAEARDSKSNRK